MLFFSEKILHVAIYNFELSDFPQKFSNLAILDSVRLWIVHGLYKLHRPTAGAEHMVDSRTRPWKISLHVTNMPLRKRTATRRSRSAGQLDYPVNPEPATSRAEYRTERQAPAEAVIAPRPIHDRPVATDYEPDTLGEFVQFNGP